MPARLKSDQGVVILEGRYTVIFLSFSFSMLHKLIKTCCRVGAKDMRRSTIQYVGTVVMFGHCH